VTVMDKYGKQIDAHTMRFERLLPGPIERVWDYLTDSEKRGEWFASGTMPTKAGEKFTIVFDHDRKLSAGSTEKPEKFRDMKFPIPSDHRLLKYEPPHLLVFDWDGNSEVEIRLAPQGDKVKLTLTHSKLPKRDDMLNISGGWHAHLGILEEKLNGRIAPSVWSYFAEMEPEYEKRIV